MPLRIIDTRTADGRAELEALRQVLHSVAGYNYLKENWEKWHKDVQRIIQNIADNGDKAVIECTKEYDRLELTAELIVTCRRRQHDRPPAELREIFHKLGAALDAGAADGGEVVAYEEHVFHGLPFDPVFTAETLSTQRTDSTWKNKQLRYFLAPQRR